MAYFTHERSNYYLDCLPEPVLVQICSHLPLVDRCSLNETSRIFQYITSIQTLTTNIDISYQYGCEKATVLSYFTQDRCQNIVSLNINHCYWLPSHLLCNVIKSCHHLKDLHALCINIEDEEIYGKFQQLRTLSWSIRFGHFMNIVKLASLNDKFTLAMMERLTVDVSDKHEEDTFILNCIFLKCGERLHSLSLLTFTNHIRRFTGFWNTLASMIRQLKSLRYIFIDKKLIFPDSELLQEIYMSGVPLESLLVTLNVQSLINIQDSAGENNGIYEVFCTPKCQKPSVLQKLKHISLRLSARNGANELYRSNSFSEFNSSYSWKYLYVEERINRNPSAFFILCVPYLINLRTLRYLTLSVHDHDFNFLYHLPHLTSINLSGYNFSPHPYNTSHRPEVKLNIHTVCNALLLMLNLLEISLPLCALSSNQHIDYQLSESTSHDEVYCGGKYVGRVFPCSRDTQSDDKTPIILSLAKSCPKVRKFELINVTFWSAFDSRVYESYNIKSCESCPQADSVNSSDLKYLYYWEHLEYISLAGLPNVHQLDFLIDVAKLCPNLTSLSLAHIGKMDYSKCTYSYSIITVLPLLTNLQDLRIEQSNLLLDNEFFTALQQCYSLKRLVIITSRVVRVSDPYQIVKVVQKLANLVFFLLFTGMSYDLCQSIQEDIMSKCRDNDKRSALAVFLMNNFIMERQSLLMSRCYRIPASHQQEIMYFASRVSSTPKSTYNQN